MEDQQDVFVRFPVWSNKTRPTYLKTKQDIKMNEIRKPAPPKEDE
jgi:spore germination protein KA